MNTISILVIKQDAEKFIESLRYGLENKADIYSAATGLDGLLMCQNLKPGIVIIDTNLEDLNGMTVSSIIKDNYECRYSLVYLIGIDCLLENTKADRYINSKIPYEILIAQIKRDFKKISGDLELSEEWENGVIRQYDCLVQDFSSVDTGGAFKVNRLLSPYHYLSGDGFFYKLLKSDDGDSSKDGLYGFIFDCEGHDLSSYGQVAAILYIIKTAMWRYQSGNLTSLNQVMAAVNEEIFSSYNSTTLIPALCFFMDINATAFRYCSAGIPTFLVKYKGHHKADSIKCRSFILGYDQDSTWDENLLKMDDVEEIILTTDGLNDLLREKSSDDNTQVFAKHDDISAIFIKKLQKK